MDKARFVETAPLVYAVEIVRYLEADSDDDTYAQDIRAGYAQDTDEEQYDLLSNPVLFRSAVDWLIRMDLIELIKDDFGPTIIKTTGFFLERREELQKDTASPFYSFGRAVNGRRWIMSALQNVEVLGKQLGVRDEDFEQPDAEWSPIPLDRDDPLLQPVITSVDEVLEQVRGANGYAETASEERTYVTAGLSALVERLRTAATISRPFIDRYGLEPLRLLAKRFKDAAPGEFVKAAITALLDWLQGK